MSAHENAFDPVEDFQMLSHPSVRIADEMMTTAAVSIPIPLDVPPPPNLSALPAHILHSGTVETLIGQNEDLMARLKVNIRRNSILEQQIMEQDRLHAKLKNDHASLTAQYQVLQEKSEMVREKSQTFDIQIEELRDQLAFAQAQIDAVEERSQELRAGLAFEKSYRRRINVWVRPFIDSLKSQVQTSNTRINFLDRQLATREAIIGDLRERIAKTETSLQMSVIKANQDQSMLVEGYEARLQTAESESMKARAESTLFRDKAARLEDAISAQATAENRIVTLERRNQDMERALTEEMKTIQSQLVNFRIEAKELAAEVINANSERDRAKSAEAEAIAELQRAQDQFESLQAVWSEAQKKFEAAKLQQESLNKLNQELSRQLKTERKARETTSVSRAPAESVQTTPSSSRLEKIDSLLAEIESGYSKARSFEETSATESARDLEAAFDNEGAGIEAVIASPKDSRGATL